MPLTKKPIIKRENTGSIEILRLRSAIINLSGCDNAYEWNDLMNRYIVCVDYPTRLRNTTIFSVRDLPAAVSSLAGFYADICSYNATLDWKACIRELPTYVTRVRR